MLFVGCVAAAGVSMSVRACSHCLNECREAILKWDKMFETTPVLRGALLFVVSGKAATGGIVTYQ
jgi:hypothetical protein